MGSKRDGYSSTAFLPVIIAQTISATTTGGQVDTRDFRACTFNVSVGTVDINAITPANDHHVLKLEESIDAEDGSIIGWGEVLPEDLLHETAGGDPGTDSNDGIFQVIAEVADGEQCHSVGYIGDSRYARLTVEKVGSPNALTIAATAVLSFPLVAPVRYPA
ncbi:MAG: hypothetical protein GY757_09140 [bacterium]|nr:hypothetical protein [bacterium]